MASNSEFNDNKLNPVQNARFWKEINEKTERIQKAHLHATQLSKEELEDQSTSYYGERQTPSVVNSPPYKYDQVFQVPEGYNNLVHRDDRRLFKEVGKSVYNEEHARTVPVLTSSEYGRRVDSPLAKLDRMLTGKTLGNARKQQ